MAADSLFGGSDDSNSLSAGSLALLNQYLTDTVEHTIEHLGTSSYVLGTGHHGETQGGILPSTGAIAGTMSDGVLQLTLNLPGSTGLVFEGLNGASPDDAGTFLKSVMDGYHNADAHKASLDAAVQQLVDAIKAQGITSVMIRVFDVMHGSTGAQGALAAGGSNDIVIDAGANASAQLFAVNLLNASETVVLKGVQNALVSNSGTIHAEGDTPIRMVGDFNAQNMGGADGNDTLAGGGGNDTLTGGLGSDTFGFSALGHYTLTDFNVAQHDTAAFAVTGVTTIGQLAAFVTGVDDAPTGVTYHFGPNASITLIGVSASQVTSDMVKFTF